MARVQHPAFRKFTQAVTEGNDALNGLVAAAFLTRRSLARRPKADATKRLPDIYPGADEIKRFGFRLENASAALLESERALSYMAIPFAVTAYNEFLVDAAELLIRDGRQPPPKPPGEMMLGQVRAYVTAQGVVGPAHDEDLFDYTYWLRNRIVHYAAAEGPAAAQRWNQLTPAQKASWKRVAGRALVTRGPGHRLDLLSGEARAAFATVRRLGGALNEVLATAISKPTWAIVITEDYRSTHPRYTNKPGELTATVASVARYAEHYYGPVTVSKASLRATVAATPPLP